MKVPPIVRVNAIASSLFTAVMLYSIGFVPEGSETVMLLNELKSILQALTSAALATVVMK